MFSNLAASELSFVPGEHILVLLQYLPQLSFHSFIQMLINSDLLTDLTPPCLFLGVLHDPLPDTVILAIRYLQLLQLQ
jgi:hypothetical protein